MRTPPAPGGTGDAIRPAAETFRRYYARGYGTWQRLSRAVAAYRQFPTDLVNFERAFQQHPYLHNRLQLTPDYYLLATGTSTWSPGHCDRDRDLPPFQRRYSIPVTVRRPIAVSIEHSPEHFPTWFGDQGNHVGILTLAWAYVLAARWTEIVPGETVLEYTESRAAWEAPAAGHDGGEMVVNLGPVSDGAARWWTAILAPGRGWTADMRHQGDIRQAPWSTNLLQTGRPIVLSRTSAETEPRLHIPAPSFRVAACIISAYSAYHGVENQSRAAFAAALMLPSAGRIKRTIGLPAPEAAPSTSKTNPSATLARPVAPWGSDVHQLDRLLTLSCNDFIQSLLSSVIFEPGVPCNVCGAWVQGAFAVLDSDIAETDLQLLTGTLMARNPRIGFLWMGATLLGTHDFVLRGMRALFYPIDLTLAGWTDTLMCFIQEPVRDAVSAEETITRADECRMLFLSQSREHTYTPLTSFQPFGTTEIADCTLEVREHARCGGFHGLCYSGWTWDCQNGAREAIPFALDSLMSPNGTTPEQETVGDDQIAVDYSGMDCERDCSERATHNMFMWLRGEDGFPVAERDIREHEWIDNFEESEDECDFPEGDGRSTAGRGNINVGRWLTRTSAYRRDSFY
ncbi:uncharacterized protein B0H64DRAFT_218660 [Chaetomium fimeti]|uniref:Uncharacterized protein n=1 Tax=Chaetomium fimeti TaxID=1854472 RepID=A0AAE0LQF8_9PEZI|nr:hypothetical protein B0H64DRAFT_218660 [Chaetomium fimeti]